MVRPLGVGVITTLTVNTPKVPVIDILGRVTELFGLVSAHRNGLLTSTNVTLIFQLEFETPLGIFSVVLHLVIFLVRSK